MGKERVEFTRQVDREGISSCLLCQGKHTASYLDRSDGITDMRHRAAL